MLNERIWNSLMACQSLREAAPPWLRSVLEMPFAEIDKLPPAANTPEVETVFRPTIELKDVTSSYLDFLRTQIKLEPRGKAWSDVLTARLNVLIPYENKKLCVLTMLRMHDRHVEGCTVRIDPDTNAIVHWEFS